MLYPYVSVKIRVIYFSHYHQMKRFALAHTFTKQAEGALQTTKNKSKCNPPHVFPYRTASTGQAKKSNAFTG